MWVTIYGQVGFQILKLLLAALNWTILSPHPPMESCPYKTDGMEEQSRKGLPEAHLTQGFTERVCSDTIQ